MNGYAYFRGRPLLLLAVGTVLAAPVPVLYAQETRAIADEAALAPDAGGQPPRSARELPDAGHDGSGYFDRGFRRIIVSRSADGHDGSGRFDHPARAGEGLGIAQGGSAKLAPR